MPTSSPVRHALEFFAQNGGAAPAVFFAPGRANLMGAHLDYNGGCVLPVALSKGTYLVASWRDDGVLRVRSTRFPGQVVEVALAELRPGRSRSWSAYVEGAVYQAARAWGPLPGLDLALHADLPMGKGVASSASVECATVYALAKLLGVEADWRTLLNLAHTAETQYVGVQCGLLDQAAVLLARADCALYLDCLSLDWRHVPLDGRRAQVAVIDSGVPRALAHSEFNRRVAECGEALALLRRRLPGITCLRQVGRPDFEACAAELPEALRRRVAHVVGEVERTSRGAAALERGDLAAFGSLMNETHLSLRDLYQVSTAELDALAAACQRQPGCYGARLTGAGFGGCAVALVQPEAAEDFARRVPVEYQRASGLSTEVQWFAPSGGPRRVT